MKVISYNILRGGQFECGNRIGAILEFLQSQKFDICGLLECDHFEKEDGKIAAIFEKELGKKMVLNKTPSGTCMALLYSPDMVLDRALTFDRYLYHGLIAADFTRNNQSFRIVLTHLNPYSSELRLLESQILVSIARRNENSLIIGDFNCPHYKAKLPLQDFKKTLIARISDENANMDSRSVLHLENQGYEDLYLKFHKESEKGTYPTSLGNKNHGYPYPVRIDYAFGSELFSKTCLSCDIADHPGMELKSDHYPVLCEFDF